MKHTRYSYKDLAYDFLGLLRALVAVYKPRPTIVLYSPVSYQARHLYPVIQYLVDNMHWEVILIGDFDCNFGCAHYSRLRYFPLYKSIDVFISTELISPWWFDGKKIFFGHGVGPKIEYQERYLSSDFDISFSPCVPAYQAHSGSGVKEKTCYRVGLPVLDSYIRGKKKIKKKDICDALGIESNRPLLIYAPSWNYRSDLNSDFGSIIEKLKECAFFTLVVSPHPNLLIDEKNEVLHDFYRHGVSVNTEFSTLDLCAVSDVVVSDISSVMYESLALNNLVIFDGNERVYRECGAGDVLSMIKEYLPHIDWTGDVCFQMKRILKKGKPVRLNEFRRKYFFNLGNSTQVFVSIVDSIIQKS